MQRTTVGKNLTGAATSPGSLRAMNDAADELTPEMEIDTSEIDAQKLLFNSEADAVGSVPPPTTVTGVVKAGVSALKGGQRIVLMDKLGERIAFERTGTRLYDALLVKLQAAQQVEPDVLPSAVFEAEAIEGNGEVRNETAEQALLRIRAEELEHFALLSAAMTRLGGDPTAMTPSADVTAVASSGIMQVLNDPRTTLAQSLNAMLTAELTDNAGWELLINLAEEAGESDLAGEFLAALGQEQGHLSIIKHWLTAIVSEEPRPALV
jgi:rubrerythrin